LELLVRKMEGHTSEDRAVLPDILQRYRDGSLGRKDDLLELEAAGE